MSQELAQLDIVIQMVKGELKVHADNLEVEDLRQAMTHLKLASKSLRKWMRKTGFIKKPKRK